MITIPSAIIFCLQIAVGLRVDNTANNLNFINPTPSPDCANSTGHLAAPVVRGSPSEYAVVTYAGISKQAYIDGAIMLRRAFKASPKSVHFVCLVGSSMSTDNKNYLKNAGWDVGEVDTWCPGSREKYDHTGYWSQSYGKVVAYGLQFKSVLFMDADTYVFRDDAATKLLDQLRDFGDSGKSDHALMARDINPATGWNTGVTIFSPSQEKLKLISTMMDYTVNDQEAINRAYTGKIQDLPPEYNRHGWATSCDNVIVAHFNGWFKPALATAANMKNIRNGYLGYAPLNLWCPELYTEYFARLLIEKPYLTPSLRDALNDEEQSSFDPVRNL
jgi:hypothetical protein